MVSIGDIDCDCEDFISFLKRPLPMDAKPIKRLFSKNILVDIYNRDRTLDLTRFCAALKLLMNVKKIPYFSRCSKHIVALSRG